MTLAELIAALEAENPNMVVPLGFTHPHSHRADYSELAFEPARNVTVADMLADARSALGATYQGWKGGDFEMRGYTDCWLATEGCCGETIGPVLLKLMLSAPQLRPSLDIRCPNCEAAPGAVCTSRDGKKMIAIHTSRIKAATP